MVINRIKKHIIIFESILLITLTLFFTYMNASMSGQPINQLTLGFFNKWYGINLIPFNDFFYILSRPTWIFKIIAYSIFGFLLYDISINFLKKDNINVFQWNIIFFVFCTIMLVLHVYTANSMGVIIDINDLIFYSIGFWIGVTLNKKVRYFIKYKKINITIQQKNHID